MKKYQRYKGIKVNSFGIPIFGTNDNSGIHIGAGKRYHQYECFDFSFAKDSPKNLIVMYDIPKDSRKERNWFRRHLKKFDYIMIQKSVWVGPSPLPKSFLQYVKEIGLSNQLIILKLAKPYVKGERDIESVKESK